MNDPHQDTQSDALLDRLMAVDEPEEELRVLETSGLMDSGGLGQLLDQAMHLARSNPGRALRLTYLCERAAIPAQAPEVLPRAIYARAQTHALNGEFHTALGLIDTAQAEYARQGDLLGALRTNLGRIHVLNELGHHSQALEAAQNILDTVENEGWTDPQARQMAAVALSNKGICLETTGQYEGALRAYDGAEAEFAALGQIERTGDVISNRGIVLVHLGRAREALEAFERAAKIQEQAGLTLLLAQTTSNMGDAYLALGAYSEALNTYLCARDLLAGLPARASHGILLRKTADAYLALNLYPEAAALYREADELLQQAGMADHHGRALWGLGSALRMLRLAEAGPVLQQAEQIFAEAGNLPMQANLLVERSVLIEEQGDMQAALDLAHAAYALVDGESAPLQRLYACLRLVDLYLEDSLRAGKFFQEAQELAATFDLPVIRYRLESRLGRAKLFEEHLEEAQAYLESAAAVAESLRGSLAHETARAAFFQDKAALYDDLLRLHLKRSPTVQGWLAFEAAETAKSRSLLDLVVGVRGESRSPAGREPDLLEEMERLQADLGAVYNRWLDMTGTADAAQVEALRSRAQSLEERLSVLRLQSSSQLAAADRFQAALARENLPAALPEGTVMLSYYVLGEEILVFVLHGGQAGGAPQVVRSVAQVGLVSDLLQRLAVHWDRFRVGGGFQDRHAAILEQSVRRVLGGLYDALIAPVVQYLPSGPGQARLVIVPHGLLHQAPFHAFFDGQRYLLETYEVVYSLSAALYGLSHATPEIKRENGLVFGLADDLIPAAEAEAANVAAQFARAGLDYQAWTGALAQRGKLLEAAAAAPIIHLACHGLFRADNPIFSSLKFSDGWLNAANILDLHLEGAVVALSACESARSRVLAGDEVIGLPRAFLGAGAAGVLVSLWLVQDEAAHALMKAWYGAWLPSGDRVSALRQAQLQVKEKYPHPFYWAPFIYLGR